MRFALRASGVGSVRTPGWHAGRGGGGGGGRGGGGSVKFTVCGLHNLKPCGTEVSDSMPVIAVSSLDAGI